MNLSNFDVDEVAALCHEAINCEGVCIERDKESAHKLADELKLKAHFGDKFSKFRLLSLLIQALSFKNSYDIMYPKKG